MGRPLNKKFFGNATNKILASAALADGGGTPENCSIIEQRSNLKYLVQSESATAVTAVSPGIQYRIVSLGDTTDWDVAGAGSNPYVGQIFTALATGTGTGSTAEVYICQLTDSTPNAIGEMTVLVTPENATTPVKPTFTVNRTAGGAIDAVTIVTAGYGYWVGGTFNVTVATDGGYVAGTEAVITYTVANGSIATANVTTLGAGYTASADAALAVAAADVPAVTATPPAENARIINARTVKTFEGNTYAWPIVAPLGGRPGRRSTSFTEADLQGS